MEIVVDEKKVKQIMYRTFSYYIVIIITSLVNVMYVDYEYIHIYILNITMLIYTIFLFTRLYDEYLSMTQPKG